MQAPSKIRIERAHRGLTQDALARACEVTQAQISRIETGRRTPSPATATRIAETLGLPPESLFEGER
ncbi:helix-turn-helix transcriptional regulator [Candidatus Deferrimicrobium sp.]|uniref:helix-turn-helix transcriptional regulator n=1 Tax=Candidatus Deferrimicrobium sp. TaxID=3060586 RepID=UPI00351D523C